ncbi:tetratricopeptide-like helical [Holotrichia oblita]|uniref:Tetratricopeptide-like helical n=1 Tax=Holotrichia oblita TaxID=644536 RepID=A0ACB9SUA7_HOLOL|nr:tetratricopeptide-like helical [Holotrichia oblita]
MSLFPAYATENEAKETVNESSKDSEAWLSLSSFTIDVQPSTDAKSNTSIAQTGESSLKCNQKLVPKKRKKKEKHQDRDDTSKTSSANIWDDFQIDKTRIKQYLSVNTISRPSVPKYHRTFSIFRKHRRPKKFKRYYRVNLEKIDDKTGSDNEGKLVKKDLSSKVPKVENENFTGFKQEEDMSQTTAFYNRSLADDPSNVDMWLKYIRFQDMVYQFEKTYRKGSIAKGQRVTAERKLAILDKALTHLPNNERLLRERLNICVSVYPADELHEQLNKLVDKEQELNISQDRSKFNLPSGFDEKQLLELEEVVLNSQLPLHELWLRIEKLRESCHWLPFTGDGECEDPQRLVFPEDVAELIHPITMPGNTFKLTATILTLLKIPLLPCRHSTMKNLGLDYVPWALDSIETVLPIFLNLYPIDLTNKLFINYSQKLTVGPQYLKPLPGQEHFLIFILQIIKNCVDSLTGYEKTAVSVWWLRFQRILYVLESQGLVKMPNSLKKQMKNEIKTLLKKEANNVVLYKEYALLEQDLGNIDSAVNILTTTLAMYSDTLVDTIQEADAKAAICSVYRTLVELHLNSSLKIYNKQHALNFLIKLSLGKTVTGESDEDLLNQTALKFKHITLLLLQKEFQPITTVQHFLPHFASDWIICNAWFLYLTKGVIDCGAFIENTLSEMDEKYPETVWEKEVLYEFYVAVLFKNCFENSGAGVFKILDDVLKRSIEQYPNNIFLLSVLAKEHTINCCLGQSFWKVKNILMKTGHALPNLFLVLIANQKVCDIQENWIDTFTGERFTEYVGLKNRMLSLFRTLTSANMCTRRCGLIWRLYLQFLHENFDPTLCRNVYYCAVEECPWLKALYIDAAIHIPAELPQIQDLLIEKQLRLHVTPEELNIMRN